MRYLVVVITFLVTTLAAVAATAQEQPIRVAISPFVYLSAAPAIPTDEAQAAVFDGMQRWVVSETDDFQLASVSALRRRLLADPLYPQIVEIARIHAREGIEKYRELDPAAASTRLASARDQFYRADHQFIEPDEVSETLLFHALALLDSKAGNPNEPLDVMKEMLLIDPAREVQPGAFPDEVVAFYQSARIDVEREVREGGPGESLPRRVAALTARRDGEQVVAATDYVLVGNVLSSGPGSVDVIVWLYDVEADQFQMPATITLRDPTPERLQRAANRLASQLLTCLVEPTDAPTAAGALPKSSGSSPFALQLNLAYASYYQFPAVGGQVVEPFDNLGAAIGGAFFLTREFAVVTMFQFLRSTSEYSGLVQAGFTTLRFFGGGEIGIGFGRFRLALGTLLEGTAVSRITTCPGDDVQARRFCQDPVELPSQWLFGVNARPRLSYRVLDSMRFYIGGSTSFYFLPLGNNAVNLLTTGEAGLQYRF